MSIEFTYFDQQGFLSNQEKKSIEAATNVAVNKIARYHKLQSIDVVLLESTWYMQKNSSFFGVCLNPHTVIVHLSPKNETFSADVEQYFSSFMVHELHHCLRYPYDRSTIGDAIVLEGMAMSAEEFLGYNRKDLGERPDQAAFNALVRRAMTEIDEIGNGSWIYSCHDGEGSWPYIYQLGQHIVGKAFENRGWNAFDQVDLSAKEIFEAARLP